MVRYNRRRVPRTRTSGLRAEASELYAENARDSPAISAFDTVLLWRPRGTWTSLLVHGEVVACEPKTDVITSRTRVPCHLVESLSNQAPRSELHMSTVLSDEYSKHFSILPGSPQIAPYCLPLYLHPSVLRYRGSIVQIDRSRKA